MSRRTTVIRTRSLKASHVISELNKYIQPLQESVSVILKVLCLPFSYITFVFKERLFVLCFSYFVQLHWLRAKHADGSQQGKRREVLEPTMEAG